uniref:Branched-chain amino acid transport system substrate-binding protein n=1 Tax=Candidatus Kentrum eta TaxID=2126337 RepID=A0A450VNS3_9GAMM|nr:MAG: branched-chain amino acid transport system substrate-binding protein [Candidatus Kentron sp. H]VFK03668.1 MAG: branched-chain amino acid transport system substrate-binding protein [Candidatus Kentron sp. H]VFK06444.1 MAG: branched-chain amino acid transport system substrate-binding protein [Candidatus Kentron sp. H]
MSTESNMKKIITRILAIIGILGSTAIQADIRIAVVAPMTGQSAVFGEQMRRGAAAAVRDINRAGGILGQQLILEVGDDACDPKQAVAVANQMVHKGVIFIAGHFCSGASIPASEVYAEEGILQISPGSTNPKLTDRGLDNVFRTCGRDDQQGIVAGNYIADHFADANVAILHDKTAYGKGLADETVKQLRIRGKQETMYEPYTQGDKDFTALVTKMKSARIGVIFIGGYHQDVGLIARQSGDQGLDAVVMSGDAIVNQEYWSITGEAGQGTLMTFSRDPRRNPVAKDVVARFQAEGYEPEGYTLYTYGAVQAFAQAAEQVGSTRLDELIAELKRSRFDTVLGKIAFDRKGDVQAPGYVVYEWRDGQYDYVME